MQPYLGFIRENNAQAAESAGPKFIANVDVLPHGNQFPERRAGFADNLVAARANDFSGKLRSVRLGRGDRNEDREPQQT